MSRELMPFSDMFNINESINDKNLFKAVFMLGAPGSGKSFIAGKAFGGSGAVTLNSDDMFELALLNNYITGDPQHIADTRKVMEIRRAMKSGKIKKIFTAEYMNDPKLQAYRADKVKPLTAKRMGFWINGMLPIVIDGTGKNIFKLENQVKFMEKIGYDVSAIYININLETSLKRNRDRYRSVDEEMLEKTWNRIMKLADEGKYIKIFDRPDRGYKEVDAEIDLRPRGVPIVEWNLDQLNKAGRKFISARLKNPVGKDVINTLKATGGKYYSDAFPDRGDFKKLQAQWQSLTK